MLYKGLGERISSPTCLFIVAENVCCCCEENEGHFFCVFISDIGKCIILYIQIIQLANPDGYHMDILATVTTVRKFSPQQDPGMKPEASLSLS